MSAMEDTREERLSREKTPEAKEEKEEESSSSSETDEEEETEEYLERLSVAKRRARSEIKLSEWDKCVPLLPSFPPSFPPSLPPCPSKEALTNNHHQNSIRQDGTSAQAHTQAEHGRYRIGFRV